MSETPRPESTSSTAGITRPIVVAIWTYVAGYLPKIAAYFGGYIPVFVMPALGLAAAMIGARLSRQEWSPRVFERKLSDRGVLLALMTGLAMAGWLAYAAVAEPLTAAAWLAMATLPLGGWYWVLNREAVRQVDNDVLVHSGPNALVYRPPNTWESIFEAAGFPGVSIQPVDTSAGVTLTVLPNPTTPIKMADVENRTADIALRTAFARPDIEIREDDVRVEPGATLPYITVHISWKRPLRATIPFQSLGPRSIAQPAPLGIDEIGEVVSARLAGQNGMTVSATDGGKTVETNVKIARITESPDALVWVGAAEKLLPLVYPWLSPWLSGKTKRPVIDAVAGENPRDVLDMLADVYLLVKLRNARNSRKSKHVPRANSCALVVILEEASSIARRREKVRTFDGVEWTASALLERICAIDRSASVAIYFLRQGALIDSLGDHGTEIDRNINLRICGRTNSSYDGTATLPSLKGNIDTSRLRDNTMLLQPHREEPRVFPWKAYYLEDDELIEPVAIRNVEWQGTLEHEFTERARWYPNRWDNGRHEDLVRECECEGFTWPGTIGGRPAVVDEDEWEEGDPVETTAAITRGVDETIETIERLTAEMRVLPAPFDELAALLDASNAPADWVSTAQLAIVLDRVSADADEKSVSDAAWQLGRDLSTIVPALRTTGPRTVGRGEDGKPRKRNGYSVPRLREAIECLRAGRPLPTEAAVADTA